MPTGINPNPGTGAAPAGTRGPARRLEQQRQSVGLFEGAQYGDSGKYRPVDQLPDARQLAAVSARSATREMKSQAPHARAATPSRRSTRATSTGTARTTSSSTTGTRSSSIAPNGTSSTSCSAPSSACPGSWQFQPGDQLLRRRLQRRRQGRGRRLQQHGLGDGVPRPAGRRRRGRAAAASPATTTAMPGWQFQKDDRFYVADFDGNGRDDLFVFNGDELGFPYVGMLRSNGLELQRSCGATTRPCPAGRCGRATSHFVGDFDGDGREDLWVFNGVGLVDTRTSGCCARTGRRSSMARRFDGQLPGWQMRPNDRLLRRRLRRRRQGRPLRLQRRRTGRPPTSGCSSRLDDWLYLAERYDGNVPGWQMRRTTGTGSGRHRRRARRPLRLQPRGLGAGVSRDDALDRHRHHGVVERGLGGRVEPRLGRPLRGRATSRASAAGANLIVHNTDWLGMIRATPSLSLPEGDLDHAVERGRVGLLAVALVHEGRHREVLDGEAGRVEDGDLVGALPAGRVAEQNVPSSVTPSRVIDPASTARLMSPLWLACSHSSTTTRTRVSSSTAISAFPGPSAPIRLTCWPGSAGKARSSIPARGATGAAAALPAETG